MEIEMLQQVIHSRQFARDSVIFREGEPSETLFVLNRGIIKIAKISEDGREQILRLLFPGDFFGLFSLLQEKTHYANAEVLERAEVCLINKKEFRTLIESNPQMAYRFMLAMSDKLQQADERIGSLGLLEVEQRLAKVLLAFYDQARMDKLKLPVPKKTLAALLGTTPETLSRKLAHLEDLRILKLERNREIRILNLEALSRTAG